MLSLFEVPPNAFHTVSILTRFPCWVCHDRISFGCKNNRHTMIAKASISPFGCYEFFILRSSFLFANSFRLLCLFEAVYLCRGMWGGTLFSDPQPCDCCSRCERH